MISPAPQTEQFVKILNDPSLRVYLSPHWGSTQNNYRINLRRSLFEVIRDLGDEMSRYQQLLALEVPPTSERFAISISHTKALGGFVLSEKFPLIGFDVEEISRVEQKVTQRVMHPDSHKAPSPAHLWSAQEAAFKALNKRLSLSVLSQINVSDWKKIDSFTYKYTANVISKSNSVSAQGGCILDGDLIYSVLISP